MKSMREREGWDESPSGSNDGAVTEGGGRLEMWFSCEKKVEVA